MKTKGFLLLLVIAFALGAGFLLHSKAGRPDYSSLPKAEDFRLLDEGGKSHELFRLTDKKAVVIIAQLNGCPLLQKSYPLIKELRDKFAPQGVEFLFINASPQDDRVSLQKEKESFGLDIPLLKDESRTIADSLGLTRSSEAVVIVPGAWRIAYRGAISDRFDYHGEKDKLVETHLDHALTAVIRGKKVDVPFTPTKGCNIEEEKKPVAFREVAPIFRAKCISCHTPDGAVPPNMHTYEQIRGWSPMIREVIRTGRMPPWPADSYYQKYADDLSLTSEEARKIILWIQSGTPFDPAKDPAKIDPPAPSQIIPKPDLVLTPAQSDTFPAKSKVQYRVYALGHAEKDMWITSIRMKEKWSSLAAHHFDLIFFDQDLPPEKVFALEALGQEEKLDVVTMRANSFFKFPEGKARFAPKGTYFYLRGHYEPTGKEEKIQPEIHLSLGKRKKYQAVKAFYKIETPLLIPAGTRVSFNSTNELPHDMWFIRCRIHMHLRGQSGRLEAKLPNGTSKVLYSVPKFLIDNQSVVFAAPIFLPAGTVLSARADYDNSALNPRNPDPTVEVRDGPGIREEMFVYSCLYY